MGDSGRGASASRSPETMKGQPWGHLSFSREGGKTEATRVFATSPLKFLVPTKVATAAVDAVWVYVLQYGGGIVAGDVIAFRVDVGSACTAVLTTQASSKVYHSNGGKTSQQIMEVTLAPGSLFALLPDPVVPFARSKYVQTQIFHLEKDASLVLVDWMTSGRKQRAEVWGFTSFETANQVYREGKPVLLDKLRLEDGRGLPVRERMAGAHVLGVMLLIGPRLEDTIRRLAQQLPARVVALQKSKALAKARAAENGSLVSGQSVGPPHVHNPVPLKQGLLSLSFSKIAGGDGLLVRFVAGSTDAAYAFLREQLEPLTAQLGSQPFPA